MKVNVLGVQYKIKQLDESRDARQFPKLLKVFKEVEVI